MLPPPPPQEAVNRKTRMTGVALLASAQTPGGRFRAANSASSKPNSAHHHHRPRKGNGRTLPGGATQAREVVASWSVASTGAKPSMFTDWGEREQEVVFGAPSHTSATAKLNPLTGVSVSVKVAVCPASIEAWDGEAESVKSSNSTVRRSVVVVVLPVVETVPDVEVSVLEVWTTVPVTVKLSDVEVTSLRFPTVSVLDIPGAMVAGLKEHVAGAMSAHPRAIDPVNPGAAETKTVNVAWAVPSRTVTEAASAVSENEEAPVPVKVIVCGLSAAESVITTEPTMVPAEAGENVTVIVQLPPELTTLPQVLDWL